MKKALLTLTVLAASIITEAQSIWDRAHLEDVRMSLGSPEYRMAFETLIRQADSLLDAVLLSVTQKEKTPASGDKHDYMSQARYFWPDPASPDGLPYINRDGYSNPEIYRLDRYPLSETAGRVTTLALAYFFTGDEKYSGKAVEFLKVWLLDEKTRMNPSLEYAQMVPGHNGGKGRQYGILDTYSFVEMLDAVCLLEGSAAFRSDDSEALKKWFSELLEWICTSEQGMAEAATANNHGTAYDAQVIAFALYSGREDIARRIIEEFPEKRIFTQIAPDGSQPAELSRTRSYHYSQYNLAHFIDIFLMSAKLGYDIDGSTSDDGRNFHNALGFLIPYISEEGRERWPYEQIDGFEEVSQNLCRDLYKTAMYISPEKAEYLSVFNRYGRVEPSDRFFLLF